MHTGGMYPILERGLSEGNKASPLISKMPNKPHPV